MCGEQNCPEKALFCFAANLGYLFPHGLGDAVCLNFRRIFWGGGLMS